jgi:uncharacterized protein (TIGR02147 family)
VGKIKKSIFEYDNYREFLKDFYAHSKQENRAFSFNYFSRLAGFKSKAVLKHVMDGHRNIADHSIDKFTKALKLNKEESVFFTNLVKFNQATTADERQIHAEALVRSRKFKLIYPMKESQFHFYATWYLAPLRELVSLADFQENPAWIAKRISPHITPQEAKKGIDELLKLGLIKRSQKGRLVQTDAVISTSDEVTSSTAAQFHRHMLRLAGESIDRVAREHRDISAQTIGVTAQTAKKIKQMIQEFRKEIMDVMYEGQGLTAVYQLNFQFFPVTTLIEPAPRIHDDADPEDAV